MRAVAGRFHQRGVISSLRPGGMKAGWSLCLFMRVGLLNLIRNGESKMTEDTVTFLDRMQKVAGSAAEPRVNEKGLKRTLTQPKPTVPLRPGPQA